MITIILTGAPKGKGRPRFSRKSGVAFTPQATRSYEGALRFAAQEEMGNKPLLLGALEVSIWALMPIPASWAKKKRAAALSGELRPTGKPDFDNLAKVVDALNQVVWTDDALIVDGGIHKFYSDRPLLAIEVSPAPPAVIPARLLPAVPDFME